MPTRDQSRGAIPIADWLFGYQKDWLQPDVIAGLTTAAVVIPKAMAYPYAPQEPLQVATCMTRGADSSLCLRLAKELCSAFSIVRS